MNLTKFHIKLAMKFMSKKELKKLSELSESEFLKSCKKNPKTKKISDESLKLMHQMIVKKVDKK